MKKLILLSFFIFLSVLLYSQTIYFNKFYNPYNTASANLSIFPVNNIYVSGGLIVDSAIYNYSSNILLSKYDSIGNLSFFKEIKGDSCGYGIGGGLVKCTNGGYVIAGNVACPYTNYNQIIRLNDNFDIIWQKRYTPDSIQFTTTSCIQTSDKGFAITGYGDAPNTNNIYIKVYKIDSSGNKLWEKRYDINGYNGGDNDIANNILETPDKGFLLGCQTYSIPTMGQYEGSGDAVVLKIDSLGNVKWVKNMGGPFTDFYAVTYVCHDGNYILGCAYAYGTAQYNTYSYSKLRLMKVNPDGYVIWDKQYFPITRSLYLTQIKEDRNGNIIAGGIQFHVKMSGRSFVDAFLVKVNSNGDSIWKRECFVSDQDSHHIAQNILYNFDITQDNGIIACGDYMVSGLINQSMWIFKTDSLGCLQPGCQYVGIKELIQAKTTLTVYPNPASTQATIAYPDIKMQGQLQVYNILGKMVYNISLDKNSTQCILNTQDYKKGLYKVILREKGEIRGQASLLITN